MIKVTTLAADGEGSLQAALAVDEPRTIVFSVSGVIDVPLLEIPFGNVTIAGQTAPGAGVTIRGRIQSAYDDQVGHIILRHLRVRPAYDGSDLSQFDAIQLGRNHHVLLDHVSAAFGANQAIDVYEARDVTIQWCSIETPNEAPNPDLFVRGVVAGPYSSRVSVHHLLCGHSLGACVSLASGPAELISSHFFDVRASFSHSDVASGPFRLVSNTFLSGPNSTLLPLLFDDEAEERDPNLSYYTHDNVLLSETQDCPAGNVDDPWEICTYAPGADASLRLEQDPDFVDASAEYVPVTVTASTETTQAALDNAGAFPRDIVTETMVADARAGTGEIDPTFPEDLLSGLAPGPAPEDGDDDGMPDEWELEHSLDPGDAADQNQRMPSGYTAIEDYINEMAAALMP